MDLTETQYDLLFEAWTISQADPPLGMVLRPECYPDADELSERGWLRRAFVGEDLAWFWTAAADQAFEFSNLLQSAAGRQN